MNILTNNKTKMKKLLLILTVVIVASCKTENVYLTVFPIKRITEITDTIYVVPDNRFKKDFHIADSLFEKASDEAMKSAHDLRMCRITFEYLGGKDLHLNRQ